MRSIHLPDGTVALPISSEHPAGLADEATAIADYLETHPDADPAAVSRMLLRTRSLRRHRVIVRAHRDRTRNDATIAALRAAAAGSAHPDVIRPGPARRLAVAMVFPGQGSQIAGMGIEFHRHCASYRRHVEDVNSEFGRVVGISPLDYLLDDDHPEDVRSVQPAIFLHTLGLARMWRDAGLRPAATIGHSQGEFAAAVESGHLSLRDGIMLVTDRAVGIEKVETSGRHEPSAMAVIGATRDAVEDRLARQTGWVELAVVNSTTIQAISGERTAVDDVVADFTAAGVFARRIRVDHAGHSSLLRHYADEFTLSAAHLDATEFHDGEIPCIGGTLGEPITRDLPPAAYWYWNLRNTVRFDLAIATAVRSGITGFVEMSEHPTMLLSIGETVAEQGADAVIVGTGKKRTDPLAEFTANALSVFGADSDFHWDADGLVDQIPLPDFPHSRFDATVYWAPPVAASPSPVVAG